LEGVHIIEHKVQKGVGRDEKERCCRKHDEKKVLIVPRRKENSRLVEVGREKSQRGFQKKGKKNSMGKSSEIRGNLQGGTRSKGGGA